MSWVTVIALTRAQLISGNSANGIVLPGNPQGVIAGAGITIDSGGIISVNASSVTGLMRLNNGTAYNAYVWPNGPGLANQQLTSDGSGGLAWSDADNIPWTTKGQLVVGTGVSTDTLLNAGVNTSFLVADSGSTSGLSYTNTLTSAVLLPVGNDTTQRPASPIVGQIRYNVTDNEFEGYGGVPAQWGPLGGVPTGGGNDKVFYPNGQVVTTDYTLEVGENAMSAGSITVNAGITVTIPAGSTWTVV